MTAPGPQVLEDRLALSVGEVAELLGISVRSVHNLIASGELASVKFAGRRLVPCHAVRAIFAGPDLVAS